MNEYVDFQNALALAIASGIGGDGEMMVQDVLWAAESVSSIKSSGTISLSHAITDYDIICVISTTTATSGANGNDDIKIIPTSTINYSSNPYDFNNFWYYYSSIVYSYAIRYGFTNNTTLSIYDAVAQNVGSYGIWKVIGIKFTGTKSIDYSTEEQVIGKYLGETLYQKTIVFSVSAKTEWIPSTITNIEKIVNQTMVMSNNSGDVISVPFYGVDGYIETQHNKAINGFLYRTNSNNLFNNYKNGYITVQYTKTTD